ncbi:hypothetical protein [Sulfurimonas sp.]|jgi:hypothetical protein|uniref:hypothetical protein n=1 Tax=Sulfurimonas sp. TaxID=2022749 RepID=UPI0025E5EF70|nr:hypothetical protein [Sulfurimonas sp.]MBT5935480.1 hypothetical protein [Sulfurimonas sp.]
MYKVDVLNGCSCFVKNGYRVSQDFASKEEAETETTRMIDAMNKNFCKRHAFSFTERFGNYKIYMKPRA